MVRFTLNGTAVETEGGRSLLSYLREEARLTGTKLSCGEGACGACSVLADGALLTSCTIPLERIAGRSIVTIEGIPEREIDAYARAFSEAGAVQCGFCTPGMVLAAKALLDRNPDPDPAEVRAALRRNLCRCTGYAKIVAGVLLTARYRRGLSGKDLPPSPGPASPAGIGARVPRIDAASKARGEARYVDDLSEPDMLFGAVLRAAHPRARLLGLDVSAARALAGVAVVATWRDIPGSRFIGSVIPDWPTLVAEGEITRCVADAVAIVAAETPARAREALALIETEYDVMDPVRSPRAALAPGAPAIHPAGNVLSRMAVKRGDADRALASAAHVVEARFSTPFTDHAFMEPESALAYPPDRNGVVLVRTGEQNVYDGQRYIAETLGIPPERVRVASAYVGGAYGGKEDQTVQHIAALLAWLSKKPVKCTLGRAESTRVHVKRHAMTIDLRLGCDSQGILVGIKERITADTGAYASLGGPVLHRAVTHAGGPYACGNLDIEGMTVYTNNPPAGAFRGFGVPQVNFALESALDALAEKAGLSPWELRFRNAVRPGALLPNGQAAGPDTALEECLLAVKERFEAARGRAGVACGFKNTGLGMGHPDIGRCVVRVLRDHVEIRSGAACTGQGLATVLAQIACDTLGLAAARVRIALPDTAATPDSGTTTASRQTLISGEACRRACAAAVAALAALEGTLSEKSPTSARSDPFPYALLAGRDFPGEYEATTDSLDSDAANPIQHVAYSYACQLAILDPDDRLERIIAAHDSGLVVNPLAFEGQVEGGVAMGMGFALTEDVPLTDCVPPARFGQLGLLRAHEVPPVETIIVRKAGSGSAVDGGISAAAYGAKGIGEISTIPTAGAIAGAYFARDGRLRTRLPLEGTPYRADSRGVPREATS
jgi:selenium-dependent xanthine dehydrogenase